MKNKNMTNDKNQKEERGRGTKNQKETEEKGDKNQKENGLHLTSKSKGCQRSQPSRKHRNRSKKDHGKCGEKKEEGRFYSGLTAWYDEFLK